MGRLVVLNNQYPALPYFNMRDGSPVTVSFGELLGVTQSATLRVKSFSLSAYSLGSSPGGWPIGITVWATPKSGVDMSTYSYTPSEGKLIFTDSIGNFTSVFQCHGATALLDFPVLADEAPWGVVTGAQQPCWATMTIEIT